MKTSRFLLAVCGLIAVGSVAVGASVAGSNANPSAKTGTGNALDVTLVRFAKGTKFADMTAAVQAAGGVVVTDLSKIGSVSADPGAQGSSAFIGKVAKQKGVTSAWEDKLIRSISPDATGDSGATGNNNPQLGNPGPNGPPDPWHNLTSFLGETNPEGILQWDDNRMNVPGAWATTKGAGVKVAVLDTGVQGSHKELLANYDNQNSASTIPCNLLTRQFGPLGQKDCSGEDESGHGTWVASRILGAANGFASNGAAPNATIIGYKVLSETLGGGLTSWIVDAMIRACDADADLINMSLGGFNDPTMVADQQDYLLWVNAVNYCRNLGTAIFASAGNDHVRINRVNMSVGGASLTGVGRVDTGDEGVGSVIPPGPLSAFDLRGLLEVPGGVPGVVMVSATNNAVPAGAPSSFAWQVQKPSVVGSRDQLTYYSNYGSRIDIAAPGGARKFNVPRYDIGNADILYGGWGTLGALDPSGGICTSSAGSILTFACFKVTGAGFGWLQGTSMSSPNSAGVAALTIAAKNLYENPNGLLARLQATARTNMVNNMVANDPDNFANTVTLGPCSTGWCHLDYLASPISFSDAYGAGMVNATAAVAP